MSIIIPTFFSVCIALCCRTFKEHCLVFLQTKKAVHRLRIVFGLLGLNSTELHGNLSQLQVCIHYLIAWYLHWGHFTTCHYDYRNVLATKVVLVIAYVHMIYVCVDLHWNGNIWNVSAMQRLLNNMCVLNCHIRIYYIVHGPLSSLGYHIVVP